MARVVTLVWIIHVLFLAVTAFRGWAFYSSRRQLRVAHITQLRNKLAGLTLAAIPFNIYGLLVYTGPLSHWVKPESELMWLILTTLAGWGGGFILAQQVKFLVGKTLSEPISYELSRPGFSAVLDRQLDIPVKDDVDRMYAEACQAVSERRYQEALPLLARCLKLNPDHRLAHKESAVVLRALGDNQAVIEHRSAVKRLDPGDTVNRYNLAKVLADVGRWKEAVAEAEELLSIAPNDSRFRSLLDRLRGGRR